MSKAVFEVLSKDTYLLLMDLFEDYSGKRDFNILLFSTKYEVLIWNLFNGSRKFSLEQFKEINKLYLLVKKRQF